MNNRRFFVLGEAALRIKPSSSPSTEGRLINAARHLAHNGKTVTFLSELGLDPAGKHIEKLLTYDGVDISCCDRFSEWCTPLVVEIDGAEERYDMSPSVEGLDIAWPRVESTDIVVFGGWLALDERVHDRLNAFLDNAIEREATIVYVPNIDSRVQRVTRVMPSVFDNLERASVVIASESDIVNLFNTDNFDKAFKNNVSFYCSQLLRADTPDALADTLASI